MLKLCCKIEINGDKTWEFEHLTSCEIVRDSEALTGTCKLVLPKRTQWKGETGNPLKRGDKIKVWLGYDEDLQLAFSGYVVRKGFKAPVEIYCEDEMYMLKQQEIKPKAYRSVKISEMLRDQELGIGIKVWDDFSLGQCSTGDTTIGNLLAGIKQRTDARFFIRLTDSGESELNCGISFKESGELKLVMESGKNIISEEVDEQENDDIRIRLKVVCLYGDNRKKNVIKMGDNFGALRTLHCYNMEESEAKAWGEQELARLKKDGLTGSFTTFGGVLVDVLDIVGVKIDGEKKGKYLVKKNTITYGNDGFRQNITLGAMVSE